MKRDKLDILFSRYIRLLEGGYCRKCHKYFGLTRGLHCAHYKSRAKSIVRFERDNATALCRNCHIHIDHNPIAKAEFFLGILGKERFEEVERKSQILSVGKNKIDREAIEKDLKEKIILLEE